MRISDEGQDQIKLTTPDKKIRQRQEKSEENDCRV